MPGKLRRPCITLGTTVVRQLVGKRTSTGESARRIPFCGAGLAYGSNTRGEC
jgi:hypothetical protein